MTAEFVDRDPPQASTKGPHIACVLRTVEDLATFARQHDLREADALLTDLLAMLYARSP